MAQGLTADQIRLEIQGDAAKAKDDDTITGLHHAWQLTEGYYNSALLGIKEIVTEHDRLVKAGSDDAQYRTAIAAMLETVRPLAEIAEEPGRGGEAQDEAD